MPKFSDISGMTFGRLMAVRPTRHRGRIGWICQCTCGQSTIVDAAAIKAGLVKSCGCLKQQVTGDKNRTHGMSRSPEYNAWIKAKQRCYDRNDRFYSAYGGCGIVVCDRWLHSFEEFFADMGPRPSVQHSLDRQNTDGPYTPENCRWATALQQMNNTRSNRRISYNGLTLTAAQWERRLNFRPGQIGQRLRAGWSTERTMMTPPGVYAPRSKSS